MEFDGECSYLKLPQEIRDLIYSHLFVRTAWDDSGTRRAELKVYDGHVILRRLWPIPPPSWAGARDVMRTCKFIYADVLAFLYAQMTFDVRITGERGDPGPRRCRLTSQYPLGRIESCPPLRHLKAIRLLLDAWSFEEMERLKVRLHNFLTAVNRAGNLDVIYIGFFFYSSARQFTDKPMRSSDEIAHMLGQLRARSRVQVYDANRTVSKECLQALLERIGGTDCTHVGW